VASVSTSGAFIAAAIAIRRETHRRSADRIEAVRVGAMAAGGANPMAGFTLEMTNTSIRGLAIERALFANRDPDRPGHDAFDGYRLKTRFWLNPGETVAWRLRPWGLRTSFEFELPTGTIFPGLYWIVVDASGTWHVEPNKPPIRETRLNRRRLRQRFEMIQEGLIRLGRVRDIGWIDHHVVVQSGRPPAGPSSDTG
jgi:hypothetical protein